MPLYEFKCEKCDHVTEEIVKLGVTEIECPKCTGKAQKKMSSSNFVVNGFSEKNGYSKRARR